MKVFIKNGLKAVGIWAVYNSFFCTYLILLNTIINGLLFWQQTASLLITFAIQVVLYLLWIIAFFTFGKRKLKHIKSRFIDFVSLIWLHILLLVFLRVLFSEIQTIVITIEHPTFFAESLIKGRASRLNIFELNAFLSIVPYIVMFCGLQSKMKV